MSPWPEITFRYCSRVANANKNFLEAVYHEVANTNGSKIMEVALFFTAKGHYKVGLRGVIEREYNFRNI